MVFEHVSEYSSQWESICSIATKIGCTAETLRKWVRRTEVDTGRWDGVTSDEQARLKELEREGRKVARCTIERLMRQMGLQGATRDRRCRGNDDRGGHPQAP